MLNLVRDVNGSTPHYRILRKNYEYITFLPRNRSITPNKLLQKGRKIESVIYHLHNKLGYYQEAKWEQKKCNQK